MFCATGILLLTLTLVQNVHHITGLPRGNPKFPQSLDHKSESRPNANTLHNSFEYRKPLTQIDSNGEEDGPEFKPILQSPKNFHFEKKSESGLGTIQILPGPQINTPQIGGKPEEKVKPEIRVAEPEEDEVHRRDEGAVDLSGIVKLPPFSPEVWDFFGHPPRAPLSILEQYKHNFGI